MNRWALAAALLAVVASSRADPGAVLSSGVLHGYYNPQQVEADVLPLIEKIAAGLADPGVPTRMRALDDLDDLARSASAYWPNLQRSPEQHDRFMRGLQIEEPPEFTAWSTMVTGLLRSHIGPYLDSVLADSTLVWDTLWAAGKIGWDTPGYRRFALAQLANPDEGKQGKAAQYLGLVGPAGIEAAQALLPGESVSHRRAIFKVFWSARDFHGLSAAQAQALADTLCSALSHYGTRTADLAAGALRKPGLDRHRIRPALLDCVRNAESSLARSCMVALCGEEPPDSSLRPIVEDLLDHNGEEVSCEALRWLSAWSDAESLVVAALDSRYPATRREALKTVTRFDLPAEQLVSPLARNLLDPRTQDAAAHACTRLGQRVAAILPTLEQAAAQSSNVFSCVYCLQAMVAVTTDTARVASTLRDYWAKIDPTFRGDILRLLPKLGADAAIFLPELEQSLHDSTTKPDEVALDAAAALGPRARHLSPLLARGLEGAAPWVRDRILRTLAAVGGYPCSRRTELEGMLGDAALTLETRVLVGRILDSGGCQ
jgi:hypothetical protein